MIECILSFDYEIYGDGRGSVRDLVYEPAERLASIFSRHGVKLVVFFEALEFEQIERHQPDEGVRDVRRQMQEFHRSGHEIGLHLHPQWANARLSAGKWHLDYSEYNLCTLAPDRIAQIVDRGIAYVRDVVGDPEYTPRSFRAGGWLFQPTGTVAKILSERGIKIDSSVFKGGLQSQRGLDYRRSLRNPAFWRFEADVNQPDPRGSLLEIPIHSEMVRPWKILTSRRMGLRQFTSMASQVYRPRRLRDFLRFKQPLKFDVCTMGLADMRAVVTGAMREDRQSPQGLRPLVAIGHTKNLHDFAAIDEFLGWLRTQGIPVVTFQSVYDRSFAAEDTPQPVYAAAQ